MSKRYMTDGEIVTFFRQAADPKAEIRILAELNNCSTDEILEALRSRGIKTPRVKNYDPSRISNYDVSGRRSKTDATQFRMGKWTDEDTQTIVSMYEDGYGYSEIARKVNRTETAVKARIWDLNRKGAAIDKGRRTRRNAWSADEDRIVIDMCRDGHSNEQIADAVGRSVSTVKSRIETLRKEGVQVAYRRKKDRDPAD